VEYTVSDSCNSLFFVPYSFYCTEPLMRNIDSCIKHKKFNQLEFFISWKQRKQRTWLVHFFMHLAAFTCSVTCVSIRGSAQGIENRKQKFQPIRNQVLWNTQLYTHRLKFLFFIFCSLIVLFLLLCGTHNLRQLIKLYQIIGMVECHSHTNASKHLIKQEEKNFTNWPIKKCFEFKEALNIKPDYYSYS